MNGLLVAALLWVTPDSTVVLSEEVQGDCAPHYIGVDYVVRHDATIPVCWTQIGDEIWIALPTGVVQVPVEAFDRVEEKP